MKGKRLVETAYHEAGHAVVAWWFGHLKKSDYVTIIPDPKTGSLGHMRNPPRLSPKWKTATGKKMAG